MGEITIRQPQVYVASLGLRFRRCRRGVLGFLNENPFIIDHGNCLRGPGDLNFGCGVVHGPILD